jgi:hypothetical protein
MMDNGGDEAIVFFAIVIFMIMRIIVPSVISLSVVVFVKFLKRNLSRKFLLVLWFTTYIIVSILLNWVLSPNFPTNREVLMKMPNHIAPRLY